VADDDGLGVVLVVAEQEAGLGAEQPGGLLGDEPEDGLGRGLAGDERRDAPQRRLLGGEARQVLEAVAQLGLERPQLARRRFALGDVEAARHDVADGAALVAQRLVGPGDDAAVAVAGDPLPLLRVGRPGGDHPADHLAERRVVLGRDDGLARVAPDHLLARPSGDALARRVEADDAAFVVQDAHERLGRVDERGADLVVDGALRDVRRVVLGDGASRAG
jgi:hypothetical protein